MKRHFLPLIIASVIILTSMSECKIPILGRNVYDEPISAVIDGDFYENEPDTLSAHQHQLNLKGYLYLYDWGFFLTISDDVYSESDVWEIAVKVTSKEPFQLDKRYPILTTEIAATMPEFTKASSVVYKNDFYYKAIAGWVEFTSFDVITHDISGIFEFDCEGHPDTPDIPIEVRDGKFGPLELGYHNYKNR